MELSRSRPGDGEEDVRAPDEIMLPRYWYPAVAGENPMSADTWKDSSMPLGVSGPGWIVSAGADRRRRGWTGRKGRRDGQGGGGMGEKARRRR